MQTQTIYHLALVLHITGLTSMAGTTLVDYVLMRQFWKQYALDIPKGIIIKRRVSMFPALFGVGFLILIISGVTMMAITHGVFGEQLWFRIKFSLIVLIIINGLFFGRRQGQILDDILTNGQDKAAGKLLKIKGNIRLFHLMQLAMFLAIYTLSVFKFN